MKLKTIYLPAVAVSLYLASCAKKDAVTENFIRTDSKLAEVQTIASGQSNKINVLLPPGYLPQSRNLHARTVIMLEYGDGYFTTDSSSVHTFIGNPSQYSYLLQTTALYDTSKGKDKFDSPVAGNYTSSAELNAAKSPVQSATSQQYIPSNKKLAVIPSINSVVSQDMVTLAVAYNGRGLKKPTLEVYYNHSNSYNFKIFDELHMGSAILCKGERTLPAIRTYNNGQVTAAGTASARNGFQNVVSFNLSANPSENAERNVFVSLMPSAKLDPYWFSSTQVYAVLKDDGSQVDAVSLQMEIPSTLVHDPNLLSIRPLNTNSKATDSEMYKYRIEFENEGDGLVYKIKAGVNLPSGTDQDLVRSSLECKLGGMDYTDVQVEFSQDNEQLYAEISALSITPQNILLWRSNSKDAELNKGEFSFVVKLPAFPYYNHCKRSEAEIFFNNEPAVSTNSVALSQAEAGVFLQRLGWQQ
jgi:hypothetical protein